MEGESCRACLQETRAEDQRIYLESGSPTWQHYSLLTSIEVKPHGNQAEYVCNHCEQKLVAFNEFRQMCLASDSAIRTLREAHPIDVKPIPNAHPPLADASFGSDGDNGADADDDAFPDPFAKCELQYKDEPMSDDNTETNPIFEPPPKRKHRATKPATIAANEGFFQCDMCDKTFTNKRRITDHLLQHVGNPQGFTCSACKMVYATQKSLDQHKHYECSQCPVAFRSKKVLHAHLRSAHDLKPYQCDRCPSGYESHKTMLRHKKKVHQDETIDVEPVVFTRSYKCAEPGCTRAFRIPKLLKEHAYQHGDRADYPLGCDLCPMRFISAVKLEDHRMRHDKIKDVVCELCGQTFYKKHMLKEHMLRHGDRAEYPHVCDECPKRFLTKRSLTLHQNRHRGIRNYACTLCEFRAYRKSDIDHHMAYHSKEPTIFCELCPSGFRTKRALNKHIKYVHLNYKPHVCEHCGDTFAQRDMWLYHTMRHTGETPQCCSICGRKYLLKENLEAHMKTHLGAGN